MPSEPNENEKQVPIAAICAPPPPTEVAENESSSNTTNGSVPQPRQPTNLQGLLHFAMEAKSDGSNLDHCVSMDKEKKEFLESALQSMTVNVVEVLQEQIKKLMQVETVKEGDDVTEYVTALETILDYIDNIDIANDFHKIGGFLILKPCLNCRHPEVKIGGCNLIAELCQNNPYCQNIALENEFVPMLIHIFNTDDNSDVKVKCIYALSAISRDNTEGYNQLVRYGAFSLFRKYLGGDDDRFRMKILFLVNSLCRSHPDLMSRLIFLEYSVACGVILCREQKPSYELALSLLLLLAENSSTALIHARECSLLKPYLETYLSTIQNQEESREEEEKCRRLLELIKK